MGSWQELAYNADGKKYKEVVIKNF